MHLSDILVVGPFGPLLLHPVRVRLGAALIGLAVGPGFAALACLTLVVGSVPLPASVRALLPEWAASPAPPAATAQQILVASTPSGAAILIGGRELGRTPATISAGHRAILTLRRAGCLDAFVAVGAPSADSTLWRAEPEVRRRHYQRGVWAKTCGLAALPRVATATAGAGPASITPKSAFP